MARSPRLTGRLDAVLFGACVILSLLATVLPAKMREPVAATLRGSMVAPLLQLQRGSERWRSAYVSSVREELKRDTLALAAARVPSLEIENNRLRQILGLGSKLQWGFIPAEALQGRGRSEDFTITLSAGSNAGVRERSLVVAPEGVVGIVQTVDPSMSIALLFAHPDFRVSAMSADASTFGIVQPYVPPVTPTGQEASYLSSERYLLELRGVPFRSQLKAGAVIFSSGLGGVYPRGIPIGVVIGEARTATAWARTYILRPAVNPSELSSVMILRPERTSGGLVNVWSDVAPVDSATRAMVAKGIIGAGDSLARQAAVDESAARRAALDTAARAFGDSARRDSLGRLDSLARVQAAATNPDSLILRARRDSAAAARARQRRRDSVAAAASAAPPPPRPDTVRRDTTGGIRP